MREGYNDENQTLLKITGFERLSEIQISLLLIFATNQ